MFKRGLEGGSVEQPRQLMYIFNPASNRVKRSSNLIFNGPGIRNDVVGVRCLALRGVVQWAL